MTRVRITFLTIVFLMIASTAMAARNISLPFEERFDNGDTWTHDLTWVACGGQATHYNSGGWQGGHADFKPPESPCTAGINGGMSTFGRLQGFSASQVNIRMLLRIGSTYYEDLRDGGGGYINKFIDVHGGTGHRYGILTINRGPGFLALGVLGDHEVYRYVTGGQWIGDAEFRIDENGSNAYTDEWICLEYEIRPADNTTRVYIWTQDGRYNGYQIVTNRTQSGPISMIDIGGYYNTYLVNNNSNHLKFDDIRIDDSFIGPPAGFLSGGGSQADNTSPSVAITAPTSGGSYNTDQATINLAGTASDNIQVDRVSWSTANGASGNASGSTSWTANAIPLVEGQNQITVRAFDSSGNTVDRNLTVTYTADTGGGGSDTTPPPAAQTIFVSDFEEGNFSEWQGGQTSGFSISNNDPHGGNYCVRADLVAGQHGDIGYADYYFGDHVASGGEKVEEAYLTLWSKFSSGYVWPSIGHKIGLFNITNASGARQYQVILFVNGNGQYAIEHSDIPDWRFYYRPQNIGSPAPVAGNVWEKLKMYVRLNTPGSSDGIIRLWVNDTLKLEYTNLNIRENTDLGLNKLILSSYANPSSGSNGTQYFDDWTLSTTDPDGSSGGGGGSQDPNPEAPTGLRIITSSN